MIFQENLLFRTYYVGNFFAFDKSAPSICIEPIILSGNSSSLWPSNKNARSIVINVAYPLTNPRMPPAIELDPKSTSTS